MRFEVRRVPANWEHPKDGHGNYIPLHNDTFDQEMLTWEQRKNHFLRGIRSPENIDKGYPSTLRVFIEAFGPGPDASNYVNYNGQECTHVAIYEEFTFGTPVTPFFPSVKDLEEHLVKIGIRGQKFGIREIQFSRESASAFIAELIHPPLGRDEGLAAARKVYEKINSAKSQVHTKHL